MKIPALLLLSACWASATTLTVTGPNGTVDANYSTSHVYVDEIAQTSVPLTFFLDPQTTNVAFAEILTNLNRRERATMDANGDGIEDGIVPPNANNIPAGDDSDYYKAYTMNLVNGGYTITLNATKTGAYRATGRYRLNGEPAGTYHYFNNDVVNGVNKRDHAIVVSPKSARDIQLYEVNPLTIIATGTQSNQRGNFADLANGVSGGPRFSLQYVKDLGCNTLWFQPIHPNGIAGRQTDPTTSQPFEVGSPYAVKNFFEVMPLMAKNFTPGGSPSTNDTPAGRAQAMTEFQSFAAAADSAGVAIMLDAPFNHTSYDAELAALGQTYFGNVNTTASTKFRNTEARFFSRTDAYDMRAFDSSSIALAPDRTDFGKFADTYDVYYGRYAALVSGTTGGYKSEADWFDTSIGSDSFAGTNNGHFDIITQRVWKYFAEYTQFWLTQTGYPQNPSGVAIDSTVGLDALRADFGQGLPPQCWEYIINKTRTRKWNFAFMAESLDGGEVTYRSGRHFDILNENIVFPLHSALTASQYRAIYDARRNAYGQALVLLNTSSHDEDHYQDPFHALIRYAANSTIDGVPLIFPGQELGLSGTVIPPNDTNAALIPFGYDRFETNSNKPIPHFKKFNSLMPLWNKTTIGNGSYNFGLAQLQPVFSAIGQARKFSTELRSSNRYFLSKTSGGDDDNIYAVAKYTTANASPATSDVVFGFVNLDRNSDHAATYAVNINGTNLFGIKSGRNYGFKNIAAYIGAYSFPNNVSRRDKFVNKTTGDQLLTSGLFVSLNKVPTIDSEWGTPNSEGHPYEAQYLKLYDITAPTTAPNTPTGPNPFAYTIGSAVSFSWQPVQSDSEGVVPSYRVNVTVNGVTTSTFNTTNPAYTFSGTVGDRVSVSVQAVNPDDTTSAGPVSTTSATIQTLSPTGDQDGDGASNLAENQAGTNPLDNASVFKIMGISTGNSQSTVTWASVVGKSYVVESSSDLTQGFTPLSGTITATQTQSSYIDMTSTGARKFYRVKLVATPAAS